MREIFSRIHMYGLVPGRFFKGGDFCLRVEIKIQVVSSFAFRGFFISCGDVLELALPRIPSFGEE